MSTTPFTPITKENAAQILSVSVRTIDHYVQDGRMPAPVHLGRRAYWHPEVFYAWLHRALGAPDAVSDAPKDVLPVFTAQPDEPAMPATPPRPATDVPRKRTNAGRSASVARSPLTTRVQERDAALLAALNG
ncbi:helix-turn-helix domain-containing protein [Caballeronia sp. GAFFF1]|uniref:helix-turn-helix transcriptional regulator n=1 Tax=Caballeronia sp. GAFFF1 TaxID=2921779 RepID=UPI0020293E93|nr:helix-turn-helix domain-containing protein [Caballeronia sp. GAFFF1]